MALKSFNNIVDTRSVSLAIEQILIAPSTTSWSPGRIDLSSAPSGFVNLGAVVEDQVTLTFTRELFQLQTGIPRVLQYSAVTGVGGRLEAQFHSLSNAIMHYALSNVDPVNTYVTTTTITSVISATHIVVGSATNMVVGGVLVTDASSLTNAFNEASISSIATNDVYLNAPGFLATPTSSELIGMLSESRIPMGTSKQKEWHIIGVADCIDGQQIIHDMQRARAGAGDMQDAFRPTANGRVQARWELFGYQTSTYLPDTELIVSERFYFPRSS